MINKLLSAEKMIRSLFIFLLIPMISYCQDKPLTCKDIHEGLFYYYPKNSSDQYSERFEDKFEYETNLKSHDSALYHISWGKDCTFSEKYVRSNIKMTLQQLSLVKEHTFIYRVTGITNTYFTFSTYMDKMPDLPIGDDTMWFHPQAHPDNQVLFTSIANSAVLRQKSFNDTSRYAVLYLYRPGKLTNFLNIYPIYLDGIEMGIEENNSGYIYKVLKEGPLEVRGTLFNHSADVSLPVQFGHIYYVKTWVHFGAGRNKTLVEMQVVDSKTGRAEFEKVKRKY